MEQGAQRYVTLALVLVLALPLALGLHHTRYSVA